MKAQILKLLSFFTVIVLAGCQVAPGQPAPVAAPQPVKVLAVETFLADMAQNVAGERLKVEALIPIGLDPHAFAPTPADVARIADSQVLIVNGAGFEGWLDEVLHNAGGQRQLIEASAGLQGRAGREGEQAVMSPEEKAEALCAALAEGKSEGTIRAGKSAAEAVELHGEEAHTTGGDEHAGEHVHELHQVDVQLATQPDGHHSGYVLLDAHEEGDYFLAVAAGEASLTRSDGGAVAFEDALPVQCAGLTQGWVAELQPGEYVLALSLFRSETTPLVFGPAVGHQHHEGDPHFWLDPTLAVRYVENIRDGLIQADPAGKEIYTRNAAAYIAKLNELDGWIRQQVQQVPEERRRIVTNHESFGYFADRYGFRVIGTVLPSVSTGASPSAQQLARLVDHIKAAGAPAIFLETGASPRLAEQIAQETGVRVVTGLHSHSITAAGGPAPTYLDMMRANTQMIVDALK